MPDIQPEFEPPAMLRLPQVPPLKVPARRQTQFIVPPSPSRYTEQIPVTLLTTPAHDFFKRMPVTPPLVSQQHRIRSPHPANQSIPATQIRAFVPARKRRREAGNGEILLGCAFLIVIGLLALALLFYLSTAM